MRGRGYGDSLVRALVERALAESFVRVSLYMDASNRPAVKLYLKLGFIDAPRPADEQETPPRTRYMERAT